MGPSIAHEVRSLRGSLKAGHRGSLSGRDLVALSRLGGGKQRDAVSDLGSVEGVEACEKVFGN